MGGWVSQEEASVDNPRSEPVKQLQDGPQHWEAAVADFLETFETWLPLETFDNAERIR